MYMATTTTNNNVEQKKTVPDNKEVKTMEKPQKQQSTQINIAELYATESAKYSARRSVPGGNALPYGEIVEAIDKVFDEADIKEAPVSVLVKMVEVILKAKYTAMKDSKIPISYTQGRGTYKMPEGELKQIRLDQLKAMSDSKQKDNLYRRIYGLGYRAEFKRFELADGKAVLRRIKSSPNSSTNNGGEQ